MGEALASRGLLPRLLCITLSALFVPRVAYPALPPASVGASAPASETASSPGPVRSASAADKQAQQDNQNVEWTFPRIRWGGTLSYDLRRDSGEDMRSSQRGLIASLNAATDTYIWQPWIAQVNGDLRLSTNLQSNRAGTSNGAFSADMKGISITGNGQLRVLPHTHTPFEAHVSRTDTRTASELVSVGNYVSERVGFSQQYTHEHGDLQLGWDRINNETEASGRDHQDSLQLSLSHNLDDHRITMMANHTRNERDVTGEHTVQDNVMLQHSFAPRDDVTVDSTANVSRAGYRLQQSDNESRVQQVSSMAFWRPEEMPLTVTGGVRVLTLDSRFNGLQPGGATEVNLRNANVNVGALYDVTQHVHVTASVNANSSETNGKGISTSSESVGATYQPDTIQFGDGFNYNWSASSSATSTSGGPQTGTLMVLQLSHNLNRNFQIDEAASITIEASQSILAQSGQVALPGELVATKQLTHGGAVSWSSALGAGTAMVRLSASDTRALDGNKEYFQLINFQASSNLPTSVYTSWNGNLTIQAVRQGGLPMVIIAPDTGLPTIIQRSSNDGNVMITSSGSVTYQHTRFAGIRNLRFTSDLRLNGQALLPILGGPQDLEVAAWDNRWDYFIGRTQLRLAMLVARTKSPVLHNQFLATQAANDPVRMNRSIMFTVIRKFGDY